MVCVKCGCSVGRADPECMLGHLLKILFKNDDFMNAVSVWANVHHGINVVSAVSSVLCFKKIQK